MMEPRSKRPITGWGPGQPPAGKAVWRHCYCQPAALVDELGPVRGADSQGRSKLARREISFLVRDEHERFGLIAFFFRDFRQPWPDLAFGRLGENGGVWRCAFSRMALFGRKNGQLLEKRQAETPRDPPLCKNIKGKRSYHRFWEKGEAFLWAVPGRG